LFGASGHGETFGGAVAGGQYGGAGGASWALLGKNG